MNDLAQRYQVHPNQILCVEEVAAGQRGRPFDPKIGMDAASASAREIEKLHAKIGQLTIENDFFPKRFGR